MISSSRDSTESNSYVKQEEDGMKRRCLSMLLAGFLTVSTVCQSVSGAEISTGEVEVQESYVQKTEESVEEPGEEEIADVQAEDAVVEKSEEKDADVDEEEETDITETVMEIEGTEIDTEVQMETVLEQVAENTKAETEEAIEETEDIQEETKVEIQTETKTAARKMQKASVAGNVAKENVKDLVTSVEFDDLVLVKGAHGFTRKEDNPKTGEKNEQWFDYYYQPGYTITMKDGTVFESHVDFNLENDVYERYIEYNDEEYEICWEDDQSVTNQWGLGKHTASVSVFGIETSFSVEIVESPVVRVTFEPIQLIKGADGSMQEDYNLDLEKREYYRYRYYPEYTVELKDGTILKYKDGIFLGDYCVEYEGKEYWLDCNDDQSYMNQWDVGKHTVSAQILGFDTSFTVEIVETPVASVEFEDIKLIENVDGYMTTWNSDTGKEEEYYYYSYRPQFTVILKDGTVLERENYHIEYNEKNYWIHYNDDQSATNQWGIGKHTISANILGFDTSFTVEIVENPVVNIEFENVKLIQNADGYMSTWNSDKEYYRYSYNPEYTITLKDGTSIVDSGYDVMYNGREYEIHYNDDQSYTNQWGVGIHTVSTKVFGIDTDFTVEIVETPVEKIEFKDIKLVEWADGDTLIEEDSEYYCYKYTPEYVVTLKDGTILESDRGYVSYNDNTYGIGSDDGQSYENQWQIGEHVVFANIIGYETYFTVEIIENPVEKITFEDISLIRNADGHIKLDYHDDRWTLEYFQYDYKPKYKILLKDGTTLEGEGNGGVEYNDKEYQLNYSDGQSITNQWDIGQYTISASILGVETSFIVEIVETPVVNVEFDEIKLIEGFDGYIDTEWGNQFYHYEYTPCYTVTLKDGTVLESNDGRIEYNGKKYATFILDKYDDDIYGFFYGQDDQSYANQWEAGKHIVPANILGFNTSFTVDIEENPIANITFQEIKLIENIGGYIYDAYNFETDEYDLQYYHYSYYPDYTITLKDGTTLNGSGSSGIEYNGKQYNMYYDDKQSYTNQWREGKYTVSANILGFDTSFIVEIVGIESVEIRDVELIENADGYMEKYDFTTGEYGDEEYFYYSYTPEVVVTLKDGTILEGSRYSGIEYNNEYYSLYDVDFGDDQSYTNQWKLGKRIIPVKIWGIETSYTVEIVESPVVSIEFEKYQCIEGADGGYKDNSWPEGEERFYYYNYYPKYTVTLKDGTILESKTTQTHFGTIQFYMEYNGKQYMPTYTDDQSETNQWGLGEHTAYMSVLGSRPFPCTVEVIETPVKEVRILELKVVDGVDGGYFKDYDQNTGEYHSHYGGYNFGSFGSIYITIILKDGTVLRAYRYAGNLFYVRYREIEYYFHIENNSWTDPWEVGEHIVPVRILGFDTSLTVIVMDSSSVVLKNYSNGVVVSTTNAVLDSDTTLIADELSIEAKDIINNTAANMGIYDMDNAVLYDIYLEKEGQKIQPNGEVTVSIPVPGTMDAEKCSVLHIDDAGNVTDMHAVYENGYMVFTTNHFSYYALVEDASGVAVGGRITSYGAENGTVTVSLLDGEAEVERVETTDGTYAFSTVPSGTYTLRVSKANHVTRTYDMTVSDEAVTQDVKICLIGDVTGDGKVNTRDLNRVYAHVNGTNPLDGYEFTCGDVTGDGKINTRDLNRLYAHISETNLLW